MAETMAPTNFDALFTKTRPHILEMICLSLDYESFKNCLDVNNAWKGVLTSRAFQKRAKAAFRSKIQVEEQKLLMASARGNSNEVRRLLSSGMVDVSSSNSQGLTPLQKAAYNGHKDVVQLLVQIGADLNEEDEDKMTALHCAAIQGHSDVTQLLLDSLADPYVIDNHGRDPLSCAIAYGHDDVMRILGDGPRQFI